MSTLTVGYGEQKITPSLGIDLTGYGFYLDRKAESVLDDLKVRGLFLKNGADYIVLISCDLVGFTIDFSDDVRRAVAATYRIKSEHIMLACIHTHSGPATQSLPGLGEVNHAYMTNVKDAIIQAVGMAADNCQESEFAFSLEHVEPIGYNRRTQNFDDIDPMLKVAIFKQQRRKIFLINYACHPVTLGPSKQVSADWPGALIRKIEEKGHRGIFFQGFCGDIDPVSNMSRWGKGGPEDLRLYGEILTNRAFKAESYAARQADTTLKVMEKRIKLPLTVCPENKIEEEAEKFLEKNDEFPGADRFVEEWKRKAYASHAEFRKNPFLENVPLQAISIGKLRMLALPGEVFCRIGVDLQKECSPLLTVGYANGNVGYLPTKQAYQAAKDYACYFAPKFYTLFPFCSHIETLLREESLELLTSLDE